MESFASPDRVHWLRRGALLGLVLLAAACGDDEIAGPAGQPPEQGGEPLPAPPIGVYQFTVTGIGGPDMTASVTPQRTLVPELMSDSALAFELASVSSFVDGARDAGGQRYITLHYRVRNATDSTMANVTLIPSTTDNTIPGTPWIRLKLFDGSNAADSIAEGIVPTGAVGLGEDLELYSLFPDVLQVFDESEVAALPMPDSVTGLFPYGFVVRSRDVAAADRALAPAVDANDYGGVLTFSFRFPLTASNGTDPFSFTFLAVAYADDEARITESIEESQDTAAVQRLRDRAAQISATTTTVLAGSMAPLASVADYPGQRRICSVRTTGAAGSPTRDITAPAALAHYMMLRPGETVDACEPGFRTGAADRPATNVPFTLTVVGMDRYGNMMTGAADTVRIEQDSGPAITIGAEAELTGGTAQIDVTWADYGSSTLRAVGSRQRGWQDIEVAGVTRTWTGAIGTSWSDTGNWSMGALPMYRDTVVVPVSASNYPLLAGAVQIAGLTVENAATLGLGTHALTLSGDVATGTSGGIDSSTGVLQLTGSGASMVGVLPSTRVTGTYSMTGNVVVRPPFRIERGEVVNTRFRLQIMN